MDRRAFLAGGVAAGLAIGAGAVAFERRTNEVAVRRYGSTTVSRRPPPTAAPDVLFLSLDDCNDWVGFLGDHPGTRTPNLDALAADSTVFTHAYCTAPMCMPARTSVMFGSLPHRNGVYDHTEASDVRYAELSETSTSLVDDYWAAGYDVVGAGKVFGRFPSRWTQGRRTPPPETSGDRTPRVGTARLPFDFGPTTSEPPDDDAADWVRRQLLAPRARPLFLAFGLIGTHLDWQVPQRYFDLHPIEDVVVPDVPADDLDDLGPAGRSFVDPTAHQRITEAGAWAQAVQAYQAAMSYADDRIGVVLDALASSPRADETIVALWSDHGFHLGEKLHWEKFTLWERATRIPMLVRAPDHAPSRFDQPVSAVDLGPTLADLSAVPILSSAHAGASLLPALASPARAGDRPPVTTWLPGNHAVRRGPWRYIRYRSGETELYDHRSDPGETVNLGKEPSLADVRRELDAFLPTPEDEVDYARPPSAAVAD